MSRRVISRCCRSGCSSWTVFRPKNISALIAANWGLQLAARTPSSRKNSVFAFTTVTPGPKSSGNFRTAGTARSRSHRRNSGGRSSNSGRAVLPAERRTGNRLQFPQRRRDGQARGADRREQAANQTNDRRPHNAAHEQLRRDFEGERDLAEALEVHRRGVEIVE